MEIRNPFVAIIGAGQVGATAAQRILEKDLADVVLFDIVEGMPQGKALDLMEAAPIECHSKNILGTNDYKDISGAEVVVVSAGFPRKPGMSREDLVSANGKIVKEASLNIKKYAPDSKVIVVTNPVDIMAYLAFKTTGFGKSRVLGMGGILDTARMRFFIAEKFGVLPGEVEGLVLGGHGDLMVPVFSKTSVKGKPVKQLMQEKDLEKISQRTRDGGAEIVSLLKTGSAFYAPASSICEMVRAILKGEKNVLPVSAYLEGEYGISSTHCGVPCELGKNGIEKVVEMELEPKEKEGLILSAKKIKEGIAEMEKSGF